MLFQLQLISKRWRDKRARKDTDQTTTLIESIREVQQSHLRRALVGVKKEKVWQTGECTTGNKHPLDNTVDENNSRKKMRKETASTNSATIYTSTNLSHTPTNMV